MFFLTGIYIYLYDLCHFSSNTCSCIITIDRLLAITFCDYGAIITIKSVWHPLSILHEHVAALLLYIERHVSLVAVVVSSYVELDIPAAFCLTTHYLLPILFLKIALLHRITRHKSFL